MQQSFNEASRAESYNKFLKKLEQTSQKQPLYLVKSTYERTLSGNREKLLHKPESLQKSGTKGDMELYDTAKLQLVGFS